MLGRRVLKKRHVLVGGGGLDRKMGKIVKT
jgi:hypothetical protein